MAAISVFTITQAVVTGTTLITYTGTITSGASPLIVGTPIIVAGCTTAAFNGTFVITGGNLTTTFTAALSHANATEAETATGTFDPEGIDAKPSNVVTPIGYGYNKGRNYPILQPYGNFIPGTLPGSGQQVIT